MATAKKASSVARAIVAAWENEVAEPMVRLTDGQADDLAARIDAVIASTANAVFGATIVIPAEATLEQAERIVIEDALKRSGGNKSRASRELGITAKTLHARLARYSEEDRVEAMR